MGTAIRQTGMILYSDPRSHYSHRVRIVLAEKGVSVDLRATQLEDLPEEVCENNPYSTLPTLMERELVLYETKLIMEYLEERFPHPSLLPEYPMARSEIRQYIYRIEKDWCPLVDRLADASLSRHARDTHKKELTEGLLAVAPTFREKSYFMSDDFSLVDCCMAPLLWRLPQLSIQLPKTRRSAILYNYMERLFRRPAFQASLSEEEQEMRL